MTWGAVILKLPEGAELEDLPNDYQVPAIGTPEQIHAVLKDLFPNQEHELGQTNYCDETCYVEFNYEKNKVVYSIGVRSNAGQTALSVMKAVCDALGLTLIDNQSGQIADLERGTQENMNEYRKWVKEVIQWRLTAS